MLAVARFLQVLLTTREIIHTQVGEDALDLWWRANKARQNDLRRAKVKSSKCYLQCGETAWKMPPAPGGQDWAPLGAKSGHSLLGHSAPRCWISACAWQPHDTQVQSQQNVTPQMPVCIFTSYFSTLKSARSECSLVDWVFKWYFFNFCLFWLSLLVVFLYIAGCSACIFFIFRVPHVHSGTSLHLPLSSPDNTHILSLNVIWKYGTQHRI